MKPDRTILIDASSLVSVFIHTAWPKGDIEGDGDGRVSWLTIRSITRLVHDFEPLDVVICGDYGGRETRSRRDLLPRYKMHRTHEPKHQIERRFFLDICRKYLPVRVLYKEGYEADDLIAYMAKQDAERGRRVLVVSKDRDMLQLQQMFPDHVTCYDVTGNQFLKIKHPDVDFTWLKALTGDSSDNIPSVTGEKTALKLLRGEHKQTLKEYLNSGTTRSEKLPRMKVFKRNLRLVSLLGEDSYLEPLTLADHPANYEFDSHSLKKVLEILAEDPDNHENDAMVQTWDSFLTKRIASSQGAIDWAQRQQDRQRLSQVAG